MVNLQFECFLIRKQLGIVSLQLDVLVQNLGVFLCKEVNGFLQLGHDIDFPLLPGDEPGHDRPDRATREQKHEQILQYLEIHIKRLSIAFYGCLLAVHTIRVIPFLYGVGWSAAFLKTGVSLLSRTTNSSPNAMLVSAFMSILKK